MGLPHCSFLELLPLVPTCCRWWTWTSGKDYHEGNGNGTATSSSMSHNHDVQISFKVAGTFCRQAAHTDLLVVPAWLPWTLLTKKGEDSAAILPSSSELVKSRDEDLIQISIFHGLNCHDVRVPQAQFASKEPLWFGVIANCGQNPNPTRSSSNIR